MRLIDAEKFCEDNPNFDSSVFVAISKAPTVDAKPVRQGRWEWKDGAAYCTAHKGKISPHIYGYGYCPLCGARMDGGAAE